MKGFHLQIMFMRNCTLIRFLWIVVCVWYSLKYLNFKWYFCLIRKFFTCKDKNLYVTKWICLLSNISGKIGQDRHISSWIAIYRLDDPGWSGTVQDNPARSGTIQDDPRRYIWWRGTSKDIILWKPSFLRWHYPMVSIK